ncbi:MAG: hypothetical protein J2P49_10795, partial [Methylocapsa sp.]|nr:hypothetical protein [Methylocapsa sp.]
KSLRRHQSAAAMPLIEVSTLLKSINRPTHGEKSSLIGFDILKKPANSSAKDTWPTIKAAKQR